jgi:hypothetical protein
MFVRLVQQFHDESKSTTDISMSIAETARQIRWSSFSWQSPGSR